MEAGSVAVEHEYLVIQSFVVVLAASSLAALVFQRLKLALIPAFICAGIFAGPSGLGLVAPSSTLDEIGHLAVVLLLFGIGMELHLSSLKQDLKTLVGSGIGSCVLCSLTGIPVALAFGLSVPQSIAVSMALALSSTALVLRLLAQSRDIGRRKGKVSLAILVTQDLFVLVMLAMIPLIASWEGAALDLAIVDEGLSLEAGFIAAIGLVGIVFLGRMALPHLLKESLRGRAPEVLMLTAVAAAFLAAYATQILGFSLEMGAFLMGFLLANSPFRHNLSSQIAPLRELFMAVFFTTLGMKVNLDIVLSTFPIILAGTAALLITKALTISIVAWLFGVQSRLAVRVGITLAQAGEFSLIIISKSADFSLLSETDVSVLTGIIVLSLLVTPALYVFAHYIADLTPELPPSPLVAPGSLSGAAANPSDLIHSLEKHVIIAGFGPVGQQISSELETRAVPHIIIELNVETVQKQQRVERPIIYGDVSNESVLRAARIEDATALVITFPDSKSALNAAVIAHGLNPNIKIVARTLSQSDKIFLDSNESYHTVSDEAATGREMSSLVNSITEMR